MLRTTRQLTAQQRSRGAQDGGSAAQYQMHARAAAAAATAAALTS